MIVIENGIVAVGFSKNNGSIIWLTDIKRNVSFVEDALAKPFRIDIGGRLEDSFTLFSYQRDKDYKIGRAHV